MGSIRIRPRIREFSNYSEDDLLKRFESGLKSTAHPFIGKVVQHHIFVKYIETEKHFWSPELTLEVASNYMQDDEYSDHKEPTILRGYISPNPSIWTLFIFAYVGLGIIWLITLMYGSSQMMLGQETLMLWYSLACVMLAGAVFIISQIGQRIAEHQTNAMIQFINERLSASDKE